MILGLVDGSRHVSDHASDEEVQNILTAKKGKIGTGTLAGVEVHTLDDLENYFEQIIFNDKDCYVIHINMGGRSRRFRTSSIIWLDFERDNK